MRCVKRIWYGAESSQPHPQTPAIAPDHLAGPSLPEVQVALDPDPKLPFVALQLLQGKTPPLVVPVAEDGHIAEEDARLRIVDRTPSRIRPRRRRG